MSENGDPDDAALLAQLDVTAERADAWRRLLAVADEFAALPHDEEDIRWKQTERRADGVMVGGYPDYAERVERACRALAEVGAVTPAYHWMRQRPRAVPDGGQLAPAEAVRLATAIVRGERFGYGTIGQAVESGTLQAVAASLSAWYRGRSNG
ncbi:DUF6508 domain-containing protein [Streptantibioticus ferralitis]|uniref:DUF6508 domain-containing protein n=1 Tax=Streptantibioticus ferralitis TaxID=236510 RepID=A0ABT5ZCG2_9ACTN|nr:DUF6508 domain-containing protein [Streptantibioticus ferralitis]MDF2261531.1 DUF6508 domain-containing protein [Streptantibioticus ferralitis]